MNSLKIRNSLILILTALIWGVAFVAQSVGGDSLGPYTFNCIRSFIGALVLIPVIFIFSKNSQSPFTSKNKQRKFLILGGLCCGACLFLGSTLQQLGLYLGASAGKTGFLTACYILLVPIIGLFFKNKCGINIWIGVVLTLIGLYMLCFDGSFSFKVADLLLLLCALFFAIHILVINYFSPLVDGIKLSCIQFFVCGILGLVPMFFSEMGHSFANIGTWAKVFTSPSAWIPILYAGIMSCGVGYTGQIIGQKGMNPTVASLLLSLESVFSVLAGWIILGETMGLKQLCGCGLIFIAIVLAQLPTKTGKNI